MVGVRGTNVKEKEGGEKGSNSRWLPEGHKILSSFMLFFFNPPEDHSYPSRISPQQVSSRAPTHPVMGLPALLLPRPLLGGSVLGQRLQSWSYCSHRSAQTLTPRPTDLKSICTSRNFVWKGNIQISIHP